MPVLRLPNFTILFLVDADISNIGVGGKLMKDIQPERSIGFIIDTRSIFVLCILFGSILFVKDWAEFN